MTKLKVRLHIIPRAQAMTEFALTLTILLLVVYGLLETGRLLFIYASTVTAARQAVRYGSATGLNGSGTEYYQDCDGIRAAVHNVGFINTFDNSDIVIAYDRGVESDGSIRQIDAGNPDPDCDNDISSMEIQNGDRIRVQVSAQWQPIVPIVPLDPFTITAESSRTILSSISIQVTAPPSGWSGTGGGELTLDVSASPSTFDTLGEIITYTYTVTNTGTATITGTFTVTDSPVASNNCTATAPASLGIGAFFTCQGTYAITQQDLDDGFVTDVAQVTGPLFSNQDGVTITAGQGPALLLTKVGTPDASAVPGTVINYTFTVTNSGNVTLRAPYAINDNQSSDESCPSTPATLAPGASVICTSTSIIKQSDVNAGTLINSATATALFGFTTVTSNVATFTVWTPPVYLTITASPISATAAGQVINYTYHLKNNTDTNMISPFTVADSMVTNESCAGAVSPLVAGATNDCTGSFTVTQAQMDAGVALVGTVTATAKQNPGNKTRTSNEVTTSISIIQSPMLSLQVSALPTTATVAGTVITYTYTLTNSGNVTLSPTFTVTDDVVTGITCANPSTTIAPAATKICTSTYTVTQADLDNGTVINTATASAMFGAQTVSSSPASFTVITYAGNRLNMTKTANFNTVAGTGQIITYTYELHNTGNAPLTNLAVTDQTVPGGFIINVDCSLAVTPLNPGKKTTCTATYTTTADDVTAGSVTNQAIGTAQNGSETVVSSAQSVTVTVLPTPPTP
jgi:uncharacterized repeat protein (TIGR01451 family)